MNKVFIVGHGPAYEEMFIKAGWAITDDINDADLVQFRGGADVSPDLYDEPKHREAHNDPVRDKFERFIFKLCVKKSIPMAGICRGGQFLNVMNGGKMYQHVDGHTRFHQAKIVGTPFSIEVSSTHHQMMRPNEDEAVLVLVAEPQGTLKQDGHYVDHWKEGELDIESVYYEKTNSLCFQPHPEFDGVDECRKFYFSCIKNYLGVG